MSTPVQRKLTTILAADAAGYSQRMEADEVGTLTELRASRGVFVRLIERHQGRVANTAGDGLIAEFPSVVEAVQCAIEVQRELAAMPHETAQLLFRIGIHLGDVIVDGQDLLGEGVNLAARLQTMAEPGGVLISQQVFDQVRSKLTVGFDYLGERRPKNYSEDIPVYSVSNGQKKRGFDFSRHASPPGPRTTAPHETPEETSPEVTEKLVRNAKLYGLVLAGLLIIDIANGRLSWAQWPALGLFLALGLQSTAILTRFGLPAFSSKLLILMAGIVLINLFSWSGDFWAVWPIGALAFFFLARNFQGSKTER